MKSKAHILAATAGLLVVAAGAMPVSALAADRPGDARRDAFRPSAEAIMIFKKRTASGPDTVGRSATTVDSGAGWPYVTEAYRRPLRSTRPYERRDQLALTLRFGDTFGFVFLEPGAPWLEPGIPWVGRRVPWIANPPRYRHAPRHAPTPRGAPPVFNEWPYSPWHRKAPAFLREWPHTPWFRDAPRFQHPRSHLRHHREAHRFHRPRRHAPRVRHIFKRWGK